MIRIGEATAVKDGQASTRAEIDAKGQQVYPEIKMILDQKRHYYVSKQKQFPDFDTEQLVDILQSFARLHGDTDKPVKGSY